MRLLGSIVAGSLDGGLMLPLRPRQLLVGACLELMWFTVETRKSLPQATQWLQEIAGAPVPHPFLLQQLHPTYVTKSIEGLASSPTSRLWMVAISNALRHFADAIRESSPSSHSSVADAISNIRDKAWSLICLSVWSRQSEEASGSIMAAVADQMLPGAYNDYLEFGVMPPMLMAYALAREFTRRPDIPVGPSGISRISEEAFRLWDLADTVAAKARTETTLAGVLIAAHECHLHYILAEILLGWAIDRHRPAESAPAEWRKERQILEELRVAMHDTLHSLGYHFAGEPGLIGYFKCMPDKVVPAQGIRIALCQTMEQAIADAVIRNPLFPNVLAPVMADCCKDIPTVLEWAPPLPGDQDSIFSQVADGVNGPFDRFRSCVSGRYRFAFSDADVVDYAQKISRRWHDSREAAEVVAKGEGLLAASSKRHQDLLSKLKDNPFVLIHRDCKHPLRLAKDPAQAVEIINQIRGTPCPGCRAELKDIDLVTFSQPK